MGLNGIDISGWQEGIDLSAVAADFVIMKATQGTGFVSKDFVRQYQQAKENGKLVGCYHYAEGGDYVAEANHFLDVVGNRVGEAILCLDWEGQDNPTFGKNDFDWVKGFCDYVFSKTGVKPLVYIQKSAMERIDGIGDYGLWIAQYPDYTPTGYQETPWNEGAYACAIRQYSSVGQISGYNGNLDLDKFYGDADSWRAYAAINGENMSPEPTPQPVVNTPDGSTLELVERTMRGEFGDGDDRRARGCFEAYQTQLKAGTLIKIASAIAILTGAIVVLSLIDSAKLASAITALTGLFAELMTSMAIFTKISGDLKNAGKTATIMLGLSVSVLILASALKKIASLSWNEIAKGLTGITVISGVLAGVAKVISKDEKTIAKGAFNLIFLATAVKILASACKDISQLSWSELAKGLTGVGVLMAEIALFLNTAKFSGKAVSTATGILVLSAAIKVLASACKDFGSMQWSEIGKGLTSIGILLTEIAAFTRVMSNYASFLRLISLM